MPLEPNPYRSPGEWVPATAVDPSALPVGAPIPFAGTLSEEQVQEACALAQSTWQRVAQWMRRCFICAAFLAVAIGLGDILTSRDRYFAHAAEGSAFLACLLAVLAYREFARPLLAHRRLASKHQGPYAYHEGCVTDEAVQMNAKSSVATIPWSQFSGYRCSESVAILLRRDSSVSLLFGRSDFRTIEEWRAFLAILERKVPGR